MIIYVEARDKLQYITYVDFCFLTLQDFLTEFPAEFFPVPAKSIACTWGTFSASKNSVEFRLIQAWLWH